MSFGKNLKKYRETTGFTQKQVANTLGITEQSYQRYECDTREPSFEVVRKIGEVFKINPGFFFIENEVSSSIFKQDTKFNERFREEVTSYCQEVGMSEETFICMLELMDKERYENIKIGLADPTLYELVRIAEVLEVSTDYLLGIKEFP